MSSTREEHRRAVVALVAAAVLWSLGGVLIKWVSWHPMAISGGRSAIAALLLGLYTVLMARAGRGPDLFGRVSRAEVVGAVAYAGTVLLFVLATKWTTAANAILLQYTAPVWVVLFGGALVGEPARGRDYAAVAVAFVGMALFFSESLTGGGLTGDVVAVLSGAAFAGLALSMRRIQGRGSALRAIVLGNVFAAVLGLPFAFAEGPALTGEGAVVLLVMGVCQLAVPYLLYARAVAHVTALEIILIPAIEPLLNPLWTALRFGELPGPLSLMGGALVLGAVTARALLARGRGAGGAERSV